MTPLLRGNDQSWLGYERRNGHGEAVRDDQSPRSLQTATPEMLRFLSHDKFCHSPKYRQGVGGEGAESWQSNPRMSVRPKYSLLHVT